MRIDLVDLSIEISNTHSAFVKEKKKDYYILTKGKLALLETIENLTNSINLIDSNNNKIYYYSCYIDDYDENKIFEYMNEILSERKFYFSFDKSIDIYSYRYNPSIELTEEELFYYKLKYPQLVKV